MTNQTNSTAKKALDTAIRLFLQLFDASGTEKLRNSLTSANTAKKTRIYFIKNRLNLSEWKKKIKIIASKRP